MKIYSYFHPVADLNVEDEIRLSILWRERWSAIRFEPVILNEHIASKHPLYKEFSAAITQLPSCNPKAYEAACYMRWMALAVAGGGWMADMDVFLNRGWDGAHLPEDNGMIVIHQTPCCPSFCYASKETAERLCMEFATASIGNRPQGERAHYSDQYAIEDLVKGGADWIRVRDVVKQWPDEGWQKAPLIHFPNAAMAPRSKSPKWKHIPALLDEAAKA